MKNTRILIGCGLIIVIGCCCLLRLPAARAADPGAPLPQILQDGFKVWAKQEMPGLAFTVWKKGGVLEENKKPEALAIFFASVDRNLGKYSSYEIVDSKSVGPSTTIYYITMRFQHAAVYSRFLVYHTDADWVIQDMDFSLKPEALMPWLSFEGTNYGQ